MRAGQPDGVLLEARVLTVGRTYRYVDGAHGEEVFVVLRRLEDEDGSYAECFALYHRGLSGVLGERETGIFSIYESSPVDRRAEELT